MKYIYTPKKEKALERSEQLQNKVFNVLDLVAELRKIKHPLFSTMSTCFHIHRSLHPEFGDSRPLKHKAATPSLLPSFLPATPSQPSEGMCHFLQEALPDGHREPTDNSGGVSIRLPSQETTREVGPGGQPRGRRTRGRGGAPPAGGRSRTRGAGFGRRSVAWVSAPLAAASRGAPGRRARAQQPPAGWVSGPGGPSARAASRCAEPAAPRPPAGTVRGRPRD